MSVVAQKIQIMFDQGYFASNNLSERRNASVELTYMIQMNKTIFIYGGAGPRSSLDNRAKIYQNMS